MPLTKFFCSRSATLLLLLLLAQIPQERALQPRPQAKAASRLSERALANKRVRGRPAASTLTVPPAPSLHRAGGVWVQGAKAAPPSKKARAESRYTPEFESEDDEGEEAGESYEGEEAEEAEEAGEEEEDDEEREREDEEEDEEEDDEEKEDREIVDDSSASDSESPRPGKRKRPRGAVSVHPDAPATNRFASLPQPLSERLEESPANPGEVCAPNTAAPVPSCADIP